MRTGSAGRFRVAGVVLLGLLVHLPALSAGFYADDYLHQLVLEGETPMSPLGLYDFGHASDWTEAAATGVASLPFWVSPEWSVRFLRPLSSLALVIDHALWGGWAAGYALSGLATFALLLLAAHRLYRALELSEGTAALALAFLAVSGATVLPVEWRANRNSLLEALFAVLAVTAALRGRLAAAFGAAAAATLCKESGAVAFLLVPLAAGLARGRPPRPAAFVGLALFAAYLCAYVALGYGTNSAFYATPWHEPTRYLRRLAELFAVTLPALAGPWPVDIAPLSPRFLVGLAALGVPLAVLLAFLLRRLLRTEPAPRLDRFLLVFVALALLPQAAAPISARLLIVPAVAASALVSRAVAAGWSRTDRGTRGSARLLLATAGPLAALATLVNGAAMAQFGGELRDATRTADVGDPALGHRTVFVLQSRNSALPFSLPNTWVALSDDHDLRFHLVQVGRRGLRWSRPDERRFVLESLDEPFLTRPFEIVYLSPEDLNALGEGSRWRSDGFEVAATRIDDTGIRELTLTLDEPPGPGDRFLVADGPHLVHRDPPAVGESVLVPSPVLPHPFVP